MDKRILVIIGVVIVITVAVILITANLTGFVVSTQRTSFNLYGGRSKNIKFGDARYRLTLDSAVEDSKATISLLNRLTRESVSATLEHGKAAKLLGLEITAASIKENYKNKGRDHVIFVISKIEVTYEGVLEMLNECDLEQTVPMNQITGDELCSKVDKTCIATIEAYPWKSGNMDVVSFRPCDEIGSPDSYSGGRSALCCSP